MTNAGADLGLKLFQLLERAIGEIADPQKSLHDIIKTSDASNAHYLELQRMHAALKTYLDTDPHLRYVAFVGSFSSGKTATINNLLEISGTEQARPEDINPVDEKLTLCAHESKEESLLATLLKSDWDADKCFHQAGALSNLILVDTPGEGDPKIRTDIVHNFLPICDTIIYCFNATNPLNSNDLPILRELNEVLQHTDFFYIYTRADNVFRKSEREPLSHENFDEGRANRQKLTFVSRLSDALAHLPARSQELFFIGNPNQFGIDELRRRILTPPGDLTSLALNKLAFFRLRSVESLDGILNMLLELSATVKQLVARAEENHQEYNAKFEIRTEEIKEFWRSAQTTLKETLSRYKSLETERILEPMDAEGIERAAIREAKTNQEIERFAATLLQALSREVGRLAKQGFDDWRRNIRERVQFETLEWIGEVHTRHEITNSLKTSLPVTEDRRIFFEQTQELVRRLSIGVSESIVASITKSCKEFKGDLDKASRHSALGEIFAVERQLSEQCKRQIASAIELYADLIDLYVSGINTAGTMLLIERAHLARDIDFLQREKISDQQKKDTTDNLVSEIFASNRATLAEIEQLCQFFPNELKRWVSECDALSKEAESLQEDILHSRLLPDLAVLAPIWDDAVQPLDDRFLESGGG